MKTLLTKCLATVKGWFASPERELAELTIYTSEGGAYTTEEILRKFKEVYQQDQQIDRLNAEVRKLSERLNGAVLNEGMLASRIGRFQTAHPELHAEFFTQAPKSKKK